MKSYVEKLKELGMVSIQEKNTDGGYDSTLQIPVLYWLQNAGNNMDSKWTSGETLWHKSMHTYNMYECIHAIMPS